MMVSPGQIDQYRRRFGEFRAQWLMKLAATPDR
jgi:hypothetical protein